MRYVYVNKKILDKKILKEWLEESEKITEQLKNAISEDEISKIIEIHEKHLKQDIFLIEKWLERAEKITYQLKIAISEDERNKIVEEYEKHLKQDIFPLKKWLEESEKITEKLKNAISEDERNKIITKYEKHWKKDIFRNWLISLFHGKCWYTEAKESVSSYHVDHFRPKGRVQELADSFRDGYWWLAFEWNNYRIAGELINVKKKDMFPLVYGYPAKPFDEKSLAIEAPVLLDPCIESEASLISFNDAGEAIPAEDIHTEQIFRVEKTIEILGLNRLGRLVNSRSLTWNKCLFKILEYKNAASVLPHQALIQVKQASAVKELKQMVKYEEEFSSVAIACIEKMAPGHLRKQIFTSPVEK
ncbi:MAG: hypothetical protein PT116_11485 [Aphanizomenon gracile PMC638.10]|nr:hypothetical protein [Aphanizomenon gracile PMC638.10]